MRADGRTSAGAASSGAGARAGASRAVAVLADDLIWGTRLADAVTQAGGTPHRVRDLAGLDGALREGAPLAIVDLTARAYDGIGAVSLAREGGARVLAVAQHDELALHRAARDAGAERVFAYRKLFEDGPAVLRAWIESPGTTERAI